MGFLFSTSPFPKNPPGVGKATTEPIQAAWAGGCFLLGSNPNSPQEWEDAVRGESLD